MQNFLEKKRESFDCININSAQSGVNSNELDLESYLHHLINLKLPPFIVSEIYQQQDEQILHQHENIPSLCQISQKIITYNRKEKSLSQLTKKFIQKFEGHQQKELVIDKVTIQMSVQRRRIYDIINIMESLNVVKKIKKNIYEWKGLIQAFKTIQSYNQYDDSQLIRIDRRSKKERSLQSLATQFLKLFSKNKNNFSQKRRLISLEQASSVIMSDQEKDSKKTKVRRLYDIVNVFKCMGLMRKIKVEGCKPVYEWMGSGELVKIIQAKINNKSHWPEQEGDSQNQIGEFENSKNVQGYKIQTFSQKQNVNQNMGKIIQHKSIRSNSNSIQLQKQSSNQILTLSKIKKSQSCSASFKKNDVSESKETKIQKSRQNRFSAFKIFRQKNSCSPLTTSTTLSTLTGSRSLKKNNISHEKNRKQFLYFDEGRSEAKEQKKQVQEQKQVEEQKQIEVQKYTSNSFKQFEYSNEEKRKAKIPKKLLKKNSSVQASQSMLSSLITGYKMMGLTSLDQFIAKIKENVFNITNNQKTQNQQIILKMNEKQNEKDQIRCKKLFQRESKSLEKKTKFTDRNVEQVSSISGRSIKEDGLNQVQECLIL